MAQHLSLLNVLIACIELFALLDGALALQCHHAAAAVHESCAMTLLSACGSWQTLLACEEPSTSTYS